MGRRYKPNPYLVRQSRKECKNAEAYNHVQKLLDDGSPKKSAAVRETALALRRCERSVWTSVREHEEALRWQAEADRQWRIEVGLEEPTDEEIEAAGDWWIQHRIDLRRGK